MPSPLWLTRLSLSSRMWSPYHPSPSTLWTTNTLSPGLSRHTRASNCKPNNFSSLTGLPPQPSHTTPIRLQHGPTPLWAWASLLREGSTRCALVNVTSRLTPHGIILTPTRSVLGAPKPRKPSHMPFCPASRPPVKDPTSSKRSRTWPLRPLSGLTSSCSLPWLS